MPKKILCIDVIEARSLAAADLNGLSDPYAVVYLGNKKIGKTSYLPRTLNPRWNKSIRYSHETEFVDALKVDVYDHDSMTTDDFLGSIQIELTIFRNGYWTNQWYRLRDQENIQPTKGYIRLKIQYINPGEEPFSLDKHDTQPEIDDESNRQKIKSDIAKKKRELYEKKNLDGNIIPTLPTDVRQYIVSNLNESDYREYIKLSQEDQNKFLYDIYQKNNPNQQSRTNNIENNNNFYNNNNFSYANHQNLSNQPIQGMNNVHQGFMYNNQISNQSFNHDNVSNMSFFG